MSVASLQLLTGTIANGAQDSSEYDAVLDRPVRISMPSAFTGANLTVWAPNSSGTYQQVYNDDGTAFTIPVAASREIKLNPADWIGIQKFKLRSDLAEGAERTIGVYVAP